MIKYRVVLKVGYQEAWFEFETAKDATKFAEVALTNMVTNEDNKKKTHINLQVVDVEAEKREEEEE